VSWSPLSSWPQGAGLMAVDIKPGSLLADLKKADHDKLEA
jgi:hypothetical protein